MDGDNTFNQQGWMAIEHLISKIKKAKKKGTLNQERYQLNAKQNSLSPFYTLTTTLSITESKRICYTRVNDIFLFILRSFDH